MFKPIDLAVCQPVRDNNVIDHNALVSTFQVENNNTRGPGYWIMNNQHFNDEKYCGSVRQIINNTITDCYPLNSKQITWEMIKINVKIVKSYHKKIVTE